MLDSVLGERDVDVSIGVTTLSAEDVNGAGRT